MPDLPGDFPANVTYEGRIDDGNFYQARSNFACDAKRGQSTNLDNENKLLQERGRSTAPTTDVRADLDV
jgi:hypothetical protein